MLYPKFPHRSVTYNLYLKSLSDPSLKLLKPIPVIVRTYKASTTYGIDRKKVYSFRLEMSLTRIGSFKTRIGYTPDNWSDLVKDAERQLCIFFREAEHLVELSKTNLDYYYYYKSAQDRLNQMQEAIVRIKDV